MSETASGTAQKSQESGIQSAPGTQGTTQAHHVARGLEQTTGHWSHVNLYRVGCTCGYKGCWYQEPTNARGAFQRHVERQRVEFR
jgi:hypothetical protein